MAIIGTAIRVLALLVMYKISNPKIVPLLPPENVDTMDLQQTKELKAVPWSFTPLILS